MRNLKDIQEELNKIKQLMVDVRKSGYGKVGARHHKDDGISSETKARLALLKITCNYLKYILTNSDNKVRMNIDASRLDEEIFRTAKNGKVFKLNTETGETSGLGPEIDGANAKASVSESSSGGSDAPAKTSGGTAATASVQPSTPQDVNLDVKPVVTHPKMKNIVDDIYKGQTPSKKSKSIIGNGTTMDAARHELKTGTKIGGSDHVKKSQDLINRLNKRIRAKDLSPQETRIANALLKDLQDALSGN